MGRDQKVNRGSREVHCIRRQVLRNIYRVRPLTVPAGTISDSGNAGLQRHLQRTELRLQVVRKQALFEGDRDESCGRILLRVELPFALGANDLKRTFERVQGLTYRFFGIPFEIRLMCIQEFLVWTLETWRGQQSGSVLSDFRVDELRIPPHHLAPCELKTKVVLIEPFIQLADCFIRCNQALRFNEEARRGRANAFVHHSKREVNKIESAEYVGFVDKELEALKLWSTAKVGLFREAEDTALFPQRGADRSQRR